MSEDNMYFSAYDGEQADEAIRRAIKGGDIDRKIDGMAVSFAITEHMTEEITVTLDPFHSLIASIPLKVLNLTLATNGIKSNLYLTEWHTIFTATAELKTSFTVDSSEYCIKFNKVPTWRSGRAYEISFMDLYGQKVVDESDVDYGKKIIAAIVKEW